MLKLIAALILSLSGIGTVVYIAPPSTWGGSGGNGGSGNETSVMAPEIDPSSAVAALTLLLGGVTVLRSRVATKK
ncbi:MAG TPA: hypothetical protein VGI90_14015 [Steroidobacteraceae bacterium]